MPHCAEIKNGKVVRVVVVQETYGDLTCEQWCEKTYGGEWIRCSYTGRIRKNYPGKGYTFDKERDAFIPPKPYESWVLNEQTANWQAPVPRPDRHAIWNEDKQDWDLVKL